MKRILSIILTLCMLITFIGISPRSGALAIDNDIKQQISVNRNDTFADAILSEDEVSKYIDYEMALKAKHVERLYNEETLSTIVYRNADNTRTAYFYDEDIKFVNSNGVIVEKDIELALKDGNYATRQNNVALKLPKELSEGVSVSYNGNSVTLIPVNNSELSKQASLTDVISGKNGVLKSAKNAVEYKSVFSDKINLTYTPTMNGVKEEIVLDSYTGVNSWSFVAQTNGMSVYCGDDGIYYFAESEDSKIKFSLGQVFVYDNSFNIDGGEMTVKELKKNDMYLITMTVDKAFLEDKNTVYPVYVDPQIDVDNSSTTANIIDTTIYSVRNTTNTGTWALNHAGYYNDSYGIGRILVKLPGLTSSEAYNSINSTQITNATFYICEATGSGGQSFNIHAFKGSNWSETTATWNNCNANNYDSKIVATATPGARAYGAFDITWLVANWRLGALNKDYGFILKSTDEVTSSKCRAFIGNNHATTTQRPKVSMTYTYQTSFIKTSADVQVGSTVSLLASSVPSGATVTWTSSDTNIATVNSSGVVTGKNSGPVTITATITGTGTTQTVKADVFVYIEDGVYYIKNNYSNKYLSASNNGISNNTDVVQTAKSTSGPSLLPQLWKIKYLGSQSYSIRPMHKLDMGLCRNGTNICINTIGTKDTSSVLNGGCKWIIKYTTSGYIFNCYSVSIEQEMGLAQINTNNGTSVVFTEMSSNQARFWGLEKLASPPSGVVIRNTKEWITPGSSLTFTASVYSSTVIDQGVTWSSSNTNVATVSSTAGVVTGKKAGLAVITAKSTVNSSIIGSFVVNVSELPNGTYFFKNKQTGKILDIQGPSSNSGTIIHQWQYYGHDSQKWILELQTDGYYTIKSAYSGLYLSVQGNSSYENAAIMQLSGGNGTGQKWKITKTDSGAYKINAKCGDIGNLCLSLENDSFDNGIAIQHKVHINDSNYMDEWQIDTPNMPAFFTEMINRGFATSTDIVSTNDGFFLLTKPLSNIFKYSGINSLYSKSDFSESDNVDNYYDDWYFYCVYSEGGYTYSLCKMREQEHEHDNGVVNADGDTPGVAISFIDLDVGIFEKCINNKNNNKYNYDLKIHIDNVIAYKSRKHHNVLRKYFSDASSNGAYLIAESYAKIIVNICYKNGYIEVPNAFTISDVLRVQEAMDRINTKSEAENGYKVYRDNKIYINNANLLSIHEKWAIILTHCANESFNSFASEVQIHSDATEGIFALVAYDSAVVADMSIEMGTGDKLLGSSQYYNTNSVYVKKQVKAHGER